MIKLNEIELMKVFFEDYKVIEDNILFNEEKINSNKNRENIIPIKEFMIIRYREENKLYDFSLFTLRKVFYDLFKVSIVDYKMKKNYKIYKRDY